MVCGKWIVIVAQTMTSMNKVMDPRETARTMQEFEKQNMKMEMTEEMSEYNIVHYNIEYNLHCSFIRLM